MKSYTALLQAEQELCSSSPSRELPASSAQEEPGLDAADADSQAQPEHSGNPGDPSRAPEEGIPGEQACLAAPVLTLTASCQLANGVGHP